MFFHPHNAKLTVELPSLGDGTPLLAVDLRVQRVIALMEDKLGRGLSLAGMAEVVGLSSSRLRHKFKSEVGVTPTVYLQTLRFRMARELLTTNHLTVKEVKAAVGITSDSYFTHQFKRTFGNPPSHFRGLLEVEIVSISERVALLQDDSLVAIATSSNG